jgi:integrase
MAASKGASYDRKLMVLGKIIPFFGERLASSIKTEDVKKFVKHMRDHPHNDKVLGHRRINMVMVVLRLMLDQAVENGWLATNPARAVKNLRVVKGDIDPLSLVEVETLLAKGFREPWEQSYFTVAFFSGLRPGEQIPLAWDALDWNVNPPVILVRVGHTRHGGTGATKTDGSKRPVEMRQRVQRAFSAQRALSGLRSDLVFPNRDGGNLNLANLRERVWRPALKRAGVRHRTLYQARHTFATLMLQAGEDIGWVANQLGHTDIQMVVKHYYRWVPRPNRQDGSLADKMLANDGSKKSENSQNG